MTEDRSELDPIERLRAADPAAGSGVDQSQPRARQTLEEILMTDEQSTPTHTAERSRSRTPWLLVAAAVVVVAGVVATVTLGGDDGMDELATDTNGSFERPGISDPASSDPASSDPAGSSEATSCVELYDLDTLADREYAFDGTVLSVEGDDMTFEVNEWFSAESVDGDADTITLDHQGNAGMLFAPDGPALEAGTRVLLAGDGGFVWSCGFTQLHDPALADQWRDALG